MKHKILQYAIMIVVVIVLNFFLPRMLPGSPIAAIAGENVGQTTSSEKAQIMASYNLDKPLGWQFVTYLKDLVTLNWGTSYTKHQPITTLIKNALPWTLLLAGSNLVLATLIGTFLGALSAFLRKRKKDLGIVLLLTLLGSVPAFWVGMVVLSLFGVTLGWFPIYGAYSTHTATGFALVIDVLNHLVMPLFTLVITSLMTFFIISRYSVLTVLNKDYVTMANMRGIPKKRVQLFYIMRNSLIPIFTVFMLEFGYIFSGSVVVETVFSYPGLGTLMYNAVLGRDYPLMQYTFMVSAIMVIFMTFLADVLYKKIDPGMVMRNEK